MTQVNESVFARFGWKFIERGISVLPIAPGTKRPGQWSKEHGWRGMSNWTQYAKRYATEEEIAEWSTWPDAGIGVLTGKLSNLVGVDKDFDLPANGNDLLDAIIPWSPVVKKGEKGWTRFFQYSGEPSRSFDANGQRVIDILSEGRQTVVPPTEHPSGCNYVWVSEQGLDELLSTNELPKLPPDFFHQIERVLLPYQTERDTKYQKKAIAPIETDEPLNTSRSLAAQHFKDINTMALAQIDNWVPKIIPNVRTHADGYRTIATWRGAKNHNVGIHRAGIFDFGGNYGMTPIDLVMYANGLQCAKATDVLCSALVWPEVEPINIIVGGVMVTIGGPQQDQVPLQPVAAAPAVLHLPPSTSVEAAPAMPSFLINPPGILREIADWITATAPKQQAELSLAAAIALVSVVMARCYRTQFGNFSSLYFIMVAKSTEGKEHPQQCVDKVLAAAGLENLMGGSGYTSTGGVYTALLKAPAHIVMIDEIGKLLKASRAKGNNHGEAAIDKMVEAFGRQGGVMRMPTYSTVTLKPGQAPPDRVIHNPAITLLGATTPGTFYSNLTPDLIQDGFLGRCIVVDSTQPRQLMTWAPVAEPTQQIIDWCKAVHASGQQGDLAGAGVPDMPPTFIELPISDSCRPLMTAFELELNTAKDAAESDALDVLLGRTLEKAMKLAMIACKAESPANKMVEPRHMEWAIAYARKYDMAVVRSVKEERHENDFDEAIKKMVKIIRNVLREGTKDARFVAAVAQGVMPHALLMKKMKMLAKPFTELVNTAVESGEILASPGAAYGYGGGLVYLVPKN